MAALDPVTDGPSDGFKTKDADTFQQLALLGPATMVADFVAGSATAALGMTESVTYKDVTKAANAADYKKFGVDMAGPSNVVKNAACLGTIFNHAADSCLLGYSLYLPAAAKTALSPFKPANGDIVSAYCSLAADHKVGIANDSAALAGLPADADAPGSTLNSATLVTAPHARKGTELLGRHAMLPGTATVPLKADLDVSGLTSTLLSALTAAEKLFTDGYMLSSHITMTLDNPATGRIAVCYACTATACTDKSGYCHQVTGITGKLNMPPNAHNVVVVVATEMAKAVATDPAVVPATELSTGVRPGLVSTALNAGAGLMIRSPVASTGTWDATAAPTTKGCLGCLIKPVAPVVVGSETAGLLVAEWYQPLANNDVAKGPRFDTALTVVAWAVSGTQTATGTAVAMTVGAAALAAGLAGVATGAAALAM